MKAAVFYGPNQPLKVEERETPKAGPGEVVVKVAACGLCHTDLGYIDHGVPTYRKPPIILGHEPSGLIAEVGEGVKDLNIGQKVLVGAEPCKKCILCKTGRGNACENLVWLGNNLDGAFAEYVKVPGSFIIPLPEQLPLVESCILTDAVGTAFHAVKDRAQVKPGDTVAVFGCGGVGICVIQFLSIIGASVIAVDVIDKKLQRAKEFGVKEAINAKDLKASKEIKRLTGGGVDIAIEVVGSPETINEAFESVRTGGRLCIIGYSPKAAQINVGKIMYRELEIVGSFGGHMHDLPRIFELVKDGRFKIEPLVTHKFSLHEINKALDTLRAGGEALRTVITV